MLTFSEVNIAFNGMVEELLVYLDISFTCNLQKIPSENKLPFELTDELGYEGGATFTHDGTQTTYRASRPKTLEEIHEYKRLLGYV